MVRRLTGIGLVVIGATGLAITVRDWIGARDCLLNPQDLLVLCGGSPPAWLFGLWFALGVLGTFLATRDRTAAG